MMISDENKIEELRPGILALPLAILGISAALSILFTFIAFIVVDQATELYANRWGHLGAAAASFAAIGMLLTYLKSTGWHRIIIGIVLWLFSFVAVLFIYIKYIKL